MSENEQNGTHEAPDSLRMVVKFPIAQYGQLEVNAWMKQGESLQAQIDAFMDEVIYHVTPRAAELAQAWTQATIASVQGDPPVVFRFRLARPRWGISPSHRPRFRK